MAHPSIAEVLGSELQVERVLRAAHRRATSTCVAADGALASAMHRRGDMVEMDGLLAVVVRAEGEDDVPDDHVMLWFGEPHTTRISKGGVGGAVPTLHTVPSAYCKPARPPRVVH